ncbi:MAG: hypothetical protein ACOYN6_09315 [Ignavibacteria bacterium]
MAKFIPSVIGKIIGKIGATTFFDRGGEHFVKPSKGEHKKSRANSVPAANNRKKFAQSHYFAKSLKLHKELAAFWNAINIKGSSAYFKLHGFNRMRCSVDSLTQDNGITPSGINIGVEDISLNTNILSFKYKLFRTYEGYMELPYKLFIVAYLNIEPLSQKEHNYVSHFRSLEIAEESEDYNQVKVEFMESLADKDIPELKKLYFFIAAVKKIPGRSAYEWSSSFVKSFDISTFEKGWYNSFELK